MRLDIDGVVQDFLQNPRMYADESVLIGECEEFGISVFCEGVTKNGGLYPNVSVWMDDDLVLEETVYSKKDFEDVLGEIDAKFFTVKAVDFKKDAREYEEEDDDPDEYPSREDELSQAVRDFMNAVYQCDPLEDMPDEDETLEEIKDQLLSVLADFDPDIYRPTELEDEDGKTELVEYPYSPV